MGKATSQKRTTIFFSFLIVFAQAFAITTGNYSVPFLIFAALILIYMFYVNKAVLLFLVLMSRVLFDSLPTITYPKLAFGFSFMEYFTLALMAFMLAYLLVYNSLKLDAICKSMLAVLMVMLVTTIYNGSVAGLIDVGSLWLYFLIAYLFFKYLSKDIPIELTLKIIFLVALYPFLNQLYSVIVGAGQIHHLGYARYAGTFYHTHNVADYLFFAIPAGIYLFVNEKAIKVRIFYCTLIVIYHIGIFMAAYRTYWIALCVFWAFYVLFVSRRKFVSIVICSLIAMATWNIFGEILSERLTAVKIIIDDPTPLFSIENYEYNNLLSGRIRIWKLSLNNYLHAPFTKKIFGLGLNSVRDFNYSYMHNEYLSSLVETGLIGLSALSMWILSVLKVVRCGMANNSKYSFLVLAIFISFLITAMGTMPFRDIRALNYLALYLASISSLKECCGKK